MPHHDFSPDAPQKPEEFLTPQQRLDAIAEILATIALRSLKNRHDTFEPRHPEERTEDLA